MSRRLQYGLMVLLIVFSLLPSTAFATDVPNVAQVTVSLDKQYVATNDTFTVTVSASGGSDIYGSAVDLLVDPGEFELTNSSVSVGSLVSTGLTETNQLYTTSRVSGVSDGTRGTAIALRLGAIQGVNANGQIGSFTLKALTAGTYYFGTGSAADPGNVTVQLVDSNGALLDLQPSQTVSLTVSEAAAAAPTISDLSSAQSNYVNTVSISFSGTGMPGHTLLPYLGTTAQTATITVGNDGTFTDTLDLPGEGTHSLRLHDEATNLDSVPVTIVVDLHAPDISVNQITAAAQTTVTGTVTDTSPVDVFVQVNPTSGPGTADAAQVNGDSYSKSLMLVSGATSLIRVTAVDKAGNASHQDRTVTVPENSSLPSLKIVPSAAVVAKDEFFTVDFNLAVPPENYTSTIRAVDMTIYFPPDILQAVNSSGLPTSSITVEDTFDLPASHSVNNTTGTISLGAAISGSNPPAGSGTIATARFKAIKAGTASFTFGSAVMKDGATNPIPHNEVNGSVEVVNGGTVAGTVTMNARTDHSGLVVKVVGEDISAVTDANGNFTLQGVSAGTHQLWVRYPDPTGVNRSSKYLIKVISDVSVQNAQTTTLSPVEILGGDATGNNFVDIDDLVVLAMSYKVPNGTAGYQATADFNDSNTVDIDDLIILANGYKVPADSIPDGE